MDISSLASGRESHFVDANEDIIGSATSAEEIISALARRGCEDLTSSLDQSACSNLPLAGGGFCDVYKGRLIDGTKVAIKALRVYDGPDADAQRKKILKHAARELYYWSKLRHPNVLPLLGLTLFRGQISMISEWMGNGNLTLFLSQNPDANRIRICGDICEGLSYIHQNGMVHGDLKGANIMVSSKGIALITDFGNAQLKDLTLRFSATTNSGLSVRWAAPELLLEEGGSRTSKEADVYAYGMTVLEVITGKVPFETVSEHRVMFLVVYGQGCPPRPDSGMPDGLWELLQLCWHKEPSKRPDIRLALDRLRSLTLSEEEALKKRHDEQKFSAYIQSLAPQERLSWAAELKSKGNSAYTARNFEAVAELYTQAIAMSPKPDPVFHSNRAACYARLEPPQYERVIDDCTSALALDPKYAKALNRRAGAYEATDKLEEALRDFTALSIIEHFDNDDASAAVERVLAKLSSKQAEGMMRGRKPRLPSVTFINAYFSAFRERPHIEAPQEPTEGDHKLRQAQEALSASDYARAHELVNAAIDSGLSESWREGLAEALNLRGTFKFLMGDTAGARTDLVESTHTWPDLSQSWVKIASMYKELGKTEAAFSALEIVAKRDPGCADIYYHRAQVLFVMGKFEQAVEDYEKSRDLDPNFIFSHIQLAVAQYKMGNVDASMEIFSNTLETFPDRGESYNYYGELLLDTQQFEDAIEKFDRAIELERQRPMPNPLPLVNKALALYQWKQDIATASTLCREALALDGESDAAVATLAQLSLQQGKFGDAIEMFVKQAEISRTEDESVTALSYANAARAQLEFQKNYPDMAGQLAAVAVGVAAPM